MGYDKCPICGVFAWSAAHECPPSWMCLHQDEYGGSDYIPPVSTFEDDGMRVYARDAEAAALVFAERYQARSSWYPSEMDVLVLDGDCKKVHKFIVLMEMVPSYSVSFLADKIVFDAVDDGGAAE